MRKAMVEKAHPQLSVRRQCELLAINRNRLQPQQPSLGRHDLLLARRMDEIALEFPEFGSRRMRETLGREGHAVSREKVRRIMRIMGIEAIYQRPKTSTPGDPAQGHRIYPYLLRELEINRPDQVWCADITYLPMARGYAYLVAVMDWQSRAVLSWRLSNTMDSDFCVAAFKDALRQTGASPEIFNTDQGSQFTSVKWINAVTDSGAKVSMDGKGRWMDNVFIERLWRAVKYEGVYLWEYENLYQLERALGKWFSDYNHRKPHQALGYKTPREVYQPVSPEILRMAA